MYNTYTVILVVGLLLAAHNVVGDDQDASITNDGCGGQAPCYDYIVVGVGQSGSVIVSRLVAAGKKVLAIEAGVRTHRSLNGTDFVAADYKLDSQGKIKIGDPWTRFDVPAFTASITSTVPAPYPEVQALLNGKQQSIHVGKLLGGSGAHNGMVWTRHTKATINSWGIKGWSWDDVLPFYKKTENVTASTQRNYPAYHGLTGPIQISDTPNKTLYSAVPLLLQACLSLGYPYNPDFNGPIRYGCGLQVYSIGDGVRYSAANAYLPSVVKKSNLKLELEAQATRILFKTVSSKMQANGVQYVQNGVNKTAYANIEVIISGSAVLTPQLLMLSGVGPAADLRALGIPVTLDSPNVGKGIQANQITTGASAYPCAPFGSAFRVSDYAHQYALNRTTSPWSHPGQFAYAYICSTTNATTPCDDPDLMLGFQAGGFFSNFNGPVATTPTLLTQVSNTLPTSKGVLKLTSKDPNAVVNITMGPYNAAELKAQIYGWRQLRKLIGIYPVNTIIGTEIAPGAIYQTDDELATWIKSGTPLYYHWVGSAKMGNAGDTTRVTDQCMNVIGIDKLRIGDSSVLPTVNSHLQATSAMLGERVADFIINGCDCNNE